MPTSALALALGAAFLHAFWNLLLARAPDVQATTAIALVTGIVAFAPVAALAWDAEPAVLPFLVVTSLLQLTYFILLSAAYSRAELSFVYPIARGTAPVLVLVAGVAVLGYAASAAQVGGVLLVAAGVLLVRGLHAHGTVGDIAFALAIAACIASYTLLDQRGIRLRVAGRLPGASMIPVTLAFVALALHRSGRPAVRRRSGCRRLPRAGHVRRLHPRARGAVSGLRGLGRGGTRDERRHRDGARGADPPRTRRAVAARRRRARRRRRRVSRVLARSRPRTSRPSKCD